MNRNVKSVREYDRAQAGVASPPRHGTCAGLAKSRYSSCSWVGLLSWTAECIYGCYFLFFETVNPP